MSENKRAKISSVGTYLYKNDRIGEDLTKETAHTTIQQPIYVPNINNIDLSQFNVAYSSNDTNKKNPYYVRLFRDPNYKGYQYPTQDIAKNTKLNLGSNKVTFLSLDNSENLVGVVDFKKNTTSKYEEAPFAPDKYSLAPPFVNGGNYGGEAYQFAYQPDLQSSDRGIFFGGCDAVKTMVEGENLDFLKPFKSKSKDAVVIPYNIDQSQRYNNFNMFASDEDKGSQEIYRFGMDGHKFNIPSSFVTKTIVYNEKSYRTVCLPNSSKFNIRGKRTSDGKFYDTSVYNMCVEPKSFFPDEEWEYYSISNNNLISYAFLCDDNGDIWVLTLSQAAFLWEGGTDPLYPGKYVSFAVLTKVDNLPLRYQRNSSNKNGFGIINRDTTIDLQKTFKNLLKLESYAYDDNAPDIIGPGDKYEDDDNAGNSIGGDSNITDNIDKPNTDPNTNYEEFIINNGLFGSYSLTADNIKNYTKTIQICRDNSWRPGELGDKCEQMANLIQENTTNVFMLPVSIQSTDTELVSFNVGTKGIRNVDNLGGFGSESSIDKARLLKKFTCVYTVDLGTISHYYDNFLDFSPFSSASLYIPYIGKVELPINLIQSTSSSKKQLSLSIRLNRTNGDLLCILFVDEIPICRWQGNCARNISMSINDNSAIMQNQLGRLVTALSSGMKAIGSASTGNVSGAVSGIGEMIAAPFSSGAPITTSSHMIGGAPESGDTGWLDSQNIILTIERPIWWKPYDYGNLIGYPTKKIAKLSSISGFAKVQQIHLRCSATESEKERLKTMLSEGVIF